jgi:hypothetical protein
MATTQGDLLNHFAHFAITQKENIHYSLSVYPLFVICVSVTRYYYK